LSPSSTSSQPTTRSSSESYTILAASRSTGTETIDTSSEIR
jgi:hypothetical protein